MKKRKSKTKTPEIKIEFLENPDFENELVDLVGEVLNSKNSEEKTKIKEEAKKYAEIHNSKK